MWFPFGLYYQSGCSQSHHCVHIVCNCHVRGGAVTVAGRSMPPSTPTSSQLLWPWCFSSLSDCSVRTVIVICQLWWSHHAYRKSGTALAHCLTFTPHTQTRTHSHLLSAAVYRLSFPLFTFSGEGEQTWPACFVMITITSMCHLFSWVLQYLSHSRHSQIWSWNTPSASSQLEGQTYSLWPHLWHGLWYFHFTKSK